MSSRIIFHYDFFELQKAPSPDFVENRSALFRGHNIRQRQMGSGNEAVLLFAARRDSKQSNLPIVIFCVIWKRQAMINRFY